MASPVHGRLPRLLPFLLLLSLALAGCPAGREGKTATASGAPHRGGTVVIGWTAGVKSINEVAIPSSVLADEVIYRLFLHLVEEQPDYAEHPPTFAPQLARSYDWSPDHKTLTFHLRDGLTWSDGVPITAEDVRWTWQAQIQPQVAWDSAYMKAEIEDVEAADPQTVRFHF